MSLLHQNQDELLAGCLTSRNDKLALPIGFFIEICEFIV